MCEYPYILEAVKNRSTSAGGFDTISNHDLSTMLTDNYFKGGNGLATPLLPRLANSSLDYNNFGATQQNYRTGGMNTSFNIMQDRMSSKNSLSYIVKQADILDENRIVLYKKGK